jgi:hypothetical protein
MDEFHKISFFLWVPDTGLTGFMGDVSIFPLDGVSRNVIPARILFDILGRIQTGAER